MITTIRLVKTAITLHSSFFWVVKTFKIYSQHFSSMWYSGRLGFDPWVGKIPRRRSWQPTQCSYLENPYGQRSLVGYSPCNCKESDTTEQLSTHIHTHTHTHTHKTKHSTLLTIVIMLYMHLQSLIIITGSLYLLTTFIHLPSPTNFFFNINLFILIGG